MNADQLIQELAVSVYQEPLTLVRYDTDYPDLSKPLHLTVLLIDADTAISMEGILGFLENTTGRYLLETIAALRVIGAPRCAAIFRAVQECMGQHGVTWDLLRADFGNAKEWQVSSFSETHGEGRDSFAKEVCKLTQGFELFNTLYSPEDAYGALCRYLEPQLPLLKKEIDARC